MPTFHFTLIVDGPDLQDRSLIDALFEAGCDDATIGCSGGVQYVDFDREAEDFDDAILSAVDDLEKLDGVEVVRIIDLHHGTGMLKQSGEAMDKTADRQEKTGGVASMQLSASLVSGFAALTSFGHPARRIPSRHPDVASALRNDWIRIGRDMGKVLARKQNG